MCFATLTFFESLALGMIGLGSILLMIEACAVLFARYEERNAFLRDLNG